MKVNFSFNSRGIVFASNVTVDNKFTQIYELSYGEKTRWMEMLDPFRDHMLLLTQRIAESGSPRVAFDRMGCHEDECFLRIISGPQGKKLSEVLLRFSPPLGRLAMPTLETMLNPHSNLTILL